MFDIVCLSGIICFFYQFSRDANYVINLLDKCGVDMGLWNIYCEWKDVT